MGENTAIEWAHHTFNPWEGCQKVGPGCDQCYAETRNARFGGGVAPNWGPGAPRRRTSPANWRKPLAWDAAAAAAGARSRVFCASLADVFDNAVPDFWRIDLAILILRTPNLDWLLLTKRIGNAEGILRAMFPDGAPANLWLGATVVNQDEVDRDVPKLLATPARIRFLSIEPMLGRIDLTSVQAPKYVPEDLDTDWRFDSLTIGDHYWFDGENGLPGDSSDGPHRDARIDWVIAGGESGPGARPSHPNWYRALRLQCATASVGGDDAPVPFLFKQWGEFLPEGQFDRQGFQWCPANADPNVHWWVAVNPVGDLPPDSCSIRVGKKQAGRSLDGVTHNGVPQ